MLRPCTIEMHPICFARAQVRCTRWLPARSHPQDREERAYLLPITKPKNLTRAKLDAMISPKSREQIALTRSKKEASIEKRDRSLG